MESTPNYRSGSDPSHRVPQNGQPIPQPHPAQRRGRQSRHISQDKNGGGEQSNHLNIPAGTVTKSTFL